MSKNKVLQPNFKISFFLPKYWLTWFGVFILYSISWLPYKIQLILGKVLGRLLLLIGGTRKKVAMKNLTLCFPDMPEKKRKHILKRNFENTGIALFETGIGWWWPNWRAKKLLTVKGLEHIEQAQSEGKKVLVLAMHNLSIELCCRGFGYTHPMVVFYRPNNNELMEFFQFRGRVRSNKYMLDKRDVRGLISALRAGDTCVYLPDQDFGRKRSLFVPFFAMPTAATTTGSLMFAKQKDVKTLFAIPSRNEDSSGYSIEILSPFKDFPSGDDEADLIKINEQVEKAVLRYPEQYMWLHRRFKTRPNKSDLSLYK